MTSRTRPRNRRSQLAYEPKKPIIEMIRTEDNPAFRLTINPRVCHISTDEMTRLLDDANRMFLHSLFGTKWKRRKSPLTILCPEIESRRSSGNQPQLLHYHGCVWTSHKRILFRYRAGGFGSIVRNLIHKRFQTQSFPTIKVQEFDPTKSWMTSATKNYGKGFDDEDTYVFGQVRSGLRRHPIL